MNESCQIDGFGPLPVARPATVAELGDLVRRADANGEAVYPIGGRTMLEVGLPPARKGIALDLRGLDKVIDYPARDMTLTVQAGITLARLQQLVAAENQQLPVDVPRADQATLGGALASNASGPRRYGYGTLRDYVLGIGVINDGGQETRAGGRVVKNVAGYDLMKLHIGALGTLGIISQVTIRVRPMPERQAILAVACPAGALGGLLDRLHTSATRPTCMDVASHTSSEPRFEVLVGFEDNATAVDWQVEKLQQELASEFRGALHSAEEARREFHRLTEATLDSSASLSFKANLLPSGVAGFLLAARASEGMTLQAHAGNGIVIGHVSGDLTLDRARTILTKLQDLAAASQGHLVVLRCPPEWKRELPVWGRPRGDAPLMRAVKERLDPRRLFNPGRYLDGL